MQYQGMRRTLTWHFDLPPDRLWPVLAATLDAESIAAMGAAGPTSVALQSGQFPIGLRPSCKGYLPIRLAGCI